MKKIILVTTGSISKEDKEKLEAEGFLVVEVPNTKDVLIINS